MTQREIKITDKQIQEAYEKYDTLHLASSELKMTTVSLWRRAKKIGLKWKDEDWKDFYYVTDRVIDAAVLWKMNSYTPNTLMSISFQFRKHLSLGRGGVILTDDKEAYLNLKKMSYDGRLPSIPWMEQNIDIVGYHYYMTPETAQLGLQKLQVACETEPKQWTVNDWPDLTKMKIFENN